MTIGTIVCVDDQAEVRRLLGDVFRAKGGHVVGFDNGEDAIAWLSTNEADLAVLDLDGIEAAVDRLGQAAGDEALREVARILQKNTRAIDAGFRIAADDFAIVMPGTSTAGAKIVADRCSAHIKEARMFDGTLTAAWGIVEAGDETAENLNTRALAALNADRAAQRG